MAVQIRYQFECDECGYESGFFDTEDEYCALHLAECEYS